LAASHSSGKGSNLSETKLAELERKIDVIMKGLNMLLFGESEAVPEKEVEDIRSRFEDYVKGKRSEFVTWDEIQTDV
jgi:hypothetical protein